MPMLFGKIVFCECGRPAMHRSESCRTCYEDGLRRKWREELLSSQVGTMPVSVRPITVCELRALGVGPLVKDFVPCRDGSEMQSQFTINAECGVRNSE